MKKEQQLGENYQQINDEEKYATNDLDKEIKWVQVNPCQRVIHNDTTLIVSNNKSLKFYSMFSINQKIRILNMNKGKFCKDSVCYFFSKSKEFITLGVDGKVRIWFQNEQCNWVPNKRILYVDYCPIDVVVVNQQENKIVTGSFNKICFWGKSSNWKCITTIKLQYDRVVSLSLSQNEKRLISVGFQYEISVFHHIENLEWQLLQRINEQRGYLLCFITNDLFVFKSDDEEFLALYKLNNNTKIFFKQMEIKVPKENKNSTFTYFTNGQHQYKFLIFQIGDQTQLTIDYGQQLHQQLSIPSILFKQTSFVRISGLKQKILLQWFKGKNNVQIHNQPTQNYFD